MIRDRSLLALLGGEFVSRLGSQFTTFNFILAVAPLRGALAEEAA